MYKKKLNNRKKDLGYRNSNSIIKKTSSNSFWRKKVHLELPFTDGSQNLKEILHLFRTYKGFKSYYFFSNTLIFKLN